MLEFLPTSHVWVLTFLSVWWAVGQVLASLIAWAFISKFSCDSALIGTVGYICDSSNNSGWRYTYYMLGGLLFVLSILRIFILKMDESPKFLISINRDAEAVAVIQKVARINGESTFVIRGRSSLI